MTTSTPAATTVSLTSEALWLAAALAGGVESLPPALRIRPVRDVAATLADHPGLAQLERAGVIVDGHLHPDIAAWVKTLGRPDVGIDIVVTRPDERPDKLLGPPPLPPKPSRDAIADALALVEWNRRQPAQRNIAFCRRDGQWASAAKLCKPGDNPIDEVVLTGLGTVDITAAPPLLFGHKSPAKWFIAINVNTEALSRVLGKWQHEPGFKPQASLESLKLTKTQAQIVELVADAGTTKSSVTVTQYGLGGPTRSPQTITVADTLLGRILITNIIGTGGKSLTSMLPGTDNAIKEVMKNLMATLPSGSGWSTHQRIAHTPVA